MNTYKMFLCSFLVCAASLLHAQNDNIIYPAQNPTLYKHLLKDKRIAYCGIVSSITPDGHSLDLLLHQGIRVTKIFAPEHGFSGTADAGAKVENSTHSQTNIPIISLYGSLKAPKKEHLADVDVIVFDIVDMGCRFNTKLITMQAIMEFAAENDVEMIIFDRPNPNGHYVDGNILDTAYRSGVGKQAVPVVHGMTPGEYAMMLNGEGLLKNKLKCKLTVIPCEGYSHKQRYFMPMFATPNLPRDHSINLYPSTCFFEGTTLSEGRGTERPFEVFGSPLLPNTGFSFTPQPRAGAANSKHYWILCNGIDLSSVETISHVELKWLVWAYQNFPKGEKFFIPFFDLLAGGPTLRQQIEAGLSAEQIRASWGEDVKKFKQVRKKYLLYEDFE